MKRLATSAPSLSFSILGRLVRVECPDPTLRQFIVTKFEAVVTAEASPPDLHYSVESGTASSSIFRAGQPSLQWADPDELLFLLEKDLTIELQKQRSDLYFLHSAALEWNGKACLLAADSGGGKSTTTWALLHHGFRYLSDELTPVDLDTLQVFPYPHALCLKRPPPDYPLPAETINLGRTFHVPVHALPAEAIEEPLPLGAVFLVKYRPDLSEPNLHPISAAEAGARLYLTALNALSHPHRGLDAAICIAERVPCFAIESAGLPATCALIRSALADCAALARSLRCLPARHALASTTSTQ